MSSDKFLSVQFQLSAPLRDLSVQVGLRSFGDRWLAVAEIEGERELGLGASASQALVAALESVGPAARTELLADLALLRPSCEIEARRVQAQG